MVEKIKSYRRQFKLNDEDNINILYVLEPIIKKWKEMKRGQENFNH